MPAAQDRFIAVLVVHFKDVSLIPYWDCVQERIALVSAAGKPSEIDAELPSDGKKALRQIDCDISLGRASAKAALGAFQREKRRFLLMVSFGFAAIGNRRGRPKIAAFVDQLPPELRAYLVLQIMGIHPEIPVGEVFDAVSFARALTPQVCVHATPSLLAGDILQGCGASGVSISAARSSPKAIREELGSARMIAKTILAEGIGSREQFDACVGAGARFLSGPFIAEPSRTIIGLLTMQEGTTASRAIAL